jgi:hypothetical protein
MTTGAALESDAVPSLAMSADPASLPWARLRPGIRIKPNGLAFIPQTRFRSTG